MKEETLLCIEASLPQILEEIFGAEFPDIKYEPIITTLSEKHLDEKSQIMGWKIDGYYNGREMTMYLRPSDIVISTILHELVHHMQWLRGSKDMYKAFPFDLSLPITKQPHELEAWSVSRKIMHKYHNKIESMISKCHFGEPW